MPIPLICRLKPYIQPFEKTLALRELSTLTEGEPSACLNLTHEETGDYRVQSFVGPELLAARLAYWEGVRLETVMDGLQFTHQVRREATVTLARNGITPAELRAALPFNGHVPLPNRRNLRYGPHGIHEYRGKFFPQLVRSLLNVADVEAGAKILDPMSGSGTTAVEAVLLGCEAYGLDMNPLSVLVSQIKCDILAVPPSQLADTFIAFRDDLLAQTGIRENRLLWFDNLSEKDRGYLSNWFAHEVLADLDRIMIRIQEIENVACRHLFLVSLSNILRRVSWQKDDDLRVRRAAPTGEMPDTVAEFLAELNRSVKTVLAFLYENQGRMVGGAFIREGNAREADLLLPAHLGQFDAIITSPPYATALPYLDTDRLSLYYLGLLSRPDHRHRDYQMIGNREISNGRRQAYWTEYQQNRTQLTGGITAVIDQIELLNRNADVGFRRQNLPALLARYFFDMRQVLATFTRLLRPGAPAYVVVGNNHTIAGGQRVEIETDQLLGELGEAVGLRLAEQIPMEMLTSRDIFKKNASSAETILCFRND
jgi:DNA modification methylase